MEFIGYDSLFLLSTFAFAQTEVSVFWAEYDGLTPEFAQNLEAAFEKANPDIDLKIVSISWDALHEKLITSLGGGRLRIFP